MRKCLRYLLYLVASGHILVANAGSYEDFFRSIKEDDAAVVLSLLQRGFDPNTPSPDGLSGLYMALREPAPKVAAVLVAWPKTNIEARTAQDESPLMMASLKGQTELVRKLIARDADVNKPGWAPLHYAATGAHLDVLELLLENNAFIDAESPNGTTPLMMAAMYGSAEAVKLLLDAGADVAMVNKLGLTALDFAKRGGRPDAVKLIQAAMAQSRAASTGQPASDAPGRQSSAPASPMPAVTPAKSPEAAVPAPATSVPAPASALGPASAPGPAQVQPQRTPGRW